MRRRHFIFATLVSLAAALPARADDDDRDDDDEGDDDDGDDDDDDHDHALKGVKDRRILDLEVLLRRFAEQIEGRVVDVRLENGGGTPVFRVTYVAPDGHVRRARLDAATGKLLG